MAFTNRTKISEYDATAANNINLGTAASPAARLGEYGVDLDAEAMRPSDTNGALRELMAHLKAMDAGTSVLTSPKAGQFLFDTTYTETGSEPQGSTYWNSDEETLDLVQNGAVLQLGQETQIHVRNNSATVTITSGTAVMAVGTVGASGRIKVDPMDAGDATTPGPKYFLGVATEDILGGGDGKVTVFGKVRSLDTSTYAESDVLWCDPATPGALTATTPSAPDLKIAAGYVVTSDLNNGVIFVRANAGIDLHENHRVQILSPDAGGNPQVDKMLLCWNNTAKRWENKTATDAGVAALSGAAFTGAVQGSTQTATFTSDQALDYSTYQNFVITLGANITLATPTTETVGQSGFLVFIQDGTGSRTVSLGTDYQSVGGSGLTLSTAANSVDVVPYIVQASGKILLGTPQLAFA